eukprot:scaffold5809_cov46-Phaeocystis_antarctica.AAC.2
MGRGRGAEVRRGMKGEGAEGAQERVVRLLLLEGRAKFKSREGPERICQRAAPRRPPRARG